MNIPSPLLRRLYTIGSLRNIENGAQFALRNRLSGAEVTESADGLGTTHFCSTFTGWRDTLRPHWPARRRATML